MEDPEFEGWVTTEIDRRLERLSAALRRGDDVAARWQEMSLAALTLLRRLRRSQRGSYGPTEDD